VSNNKQARSNHHNHINSNSYQNHEGQGDKKDTKVHSNSNSYSEDAQNEFVNAQINLD
jgi:hypothetical protein